MEAGKENFGDEIINKNLFMGVKEWLIWPYPIVFLKPILAGWSYKKMKQG